jgi:hypothetical protein
LSERWWLRAIIIGSLCWFLVGCQRDPWADRFLRRQPQERDLVGTYRIDSDTLARRISVPMSTTALSISRDSAIVLSADHKAKFSQVPEIHPPATQSCLVNGSGSWELGRNDAYSVVNVQIQRNVDRPSVDGCEPTYYGQLMLYGKQSPYKLHITIGDPDSGDAMQFEKID